MSLFDKIKEIFASSPEPESPETDKQEVISINELSDKVKSLSKSLETKSQGVRLEIEEKISSLAKGLADSLEALKTVDLTKRKEHEKIKLVVQDNLNLYCEYLKKLADDLKKIKEVSLANHFNKIFSTLNEFSRISHMPYEKATYLVGKEMASARSRVIEFGQSVSALAEQNKSLFEETRQIEKLFNLNSEFEESRKLKDTLKHETSHLNQKIEVLGDESEIINKDILNVKDSADCKNDIEEKQNFLKKQKDFEKELQEIKQKINFKALASVFHHDKKKAQLIKDYSNNFREALRADMDLEIIAMAGESQKVDFSRLSELRNSLDAEIPVSKTENKISKLEDKLRGLETEIAAAKANIGEENKKLEKITKKQEKILSELKSLLAQINITLNL